MLTVLRLLNKQAQSIKDYIKGDALISIDMLDTIWKMFGQIKFEQFDIVMVALLYLPNDNKKRRFSKCYLQFIKSLKLILLFMLYNSILKISPSNYANRFESTAVDLFSNQKNINEVMKELLKDLKVDTISKESVREAIIHLDCTSAKKDSRKTSRDLKLAKYVIQIVDDNYMEDLKSEHILPESLDRTVVYQCGNIVPVINDRYGNKNINEKLVMYNNDSNVNSSLKKFLQLNPDENNIEEIIKKRTLQIADEFWNIFEELRSECLQ